MNENDEGTVYDREKVDAVLEDVIHRLKALDFLIECMTEKAEAAIEGT